MKKRKILYGLTALLLLGAPLTALSSCGGGNDPVKPTPGPGGNTETDGKIVSFDAKLSLNEDNRNLKKGETINVVISNVLNDKGNNVEKFEYIVEVLENGTEAAPVIEATPNGTITAKNAGTAKVAVNVRGCSADDKVFQIVVEEQDADIAKGGFSFVSSANPYQDKLDILGKLEKYAVEEHLTGITLFQNGGYVMYNPRIKKPTNEYITGYGFGILTEGEITADLAAEPNDAWKRYYHTFGGTDNKQKFNYLDDTGSESADLYGYVTSTYYTQKMNATKNGYDWAPLLAKEAPAKDTQNGKFDSKKPIPLNFNEGTGLATKYKVYLKTGKDGVKYNTLSTWDKVKGFAGRDVALEDYITPFKLLLNKNLDLARSTDYTSDSSDGTLRGARAFYSACSTGDLTDEAMYGKNGLFYKLVGIEPNEAEGSITFTFNNPISPFEAMTNLSSSMNSPIPVDFLKAIAPDTSSGTATFKSAMNDAYGTTVKGNDQIGPKDTLLSVGPYVVETTSGENNVFKRNPLYIEKESEGRYKIPGVKIQYYKGAASDKNFTFTKFIEDGILDAVSIPKEFMDKYVNDERTTTTQGDSTFKLNLNTFTQEEWDNNPAFKENGGITYKCEPLMSNDNFINALSFALDRETFATSRGNVPSQSYFAPAYLWDPENGKPYDETPQHKAVIAEYSPSTYGYDQTIAVQLMDEAITEEVNKNNYTWTGEKSKATIDITWMNTTDEEEFGKEIKGYIEDAFSKTQAAARGFKLQVNNINGTTNYQHVYDVMKKGTFDIAFGSVSGMQLDPLGFMEVLKSNNITGFTTNWGTDTSKVSETNPIYYKGKKWSFDGLWDAANKGAIISKTGEVVKDPVKLEASTDVASTTTQLTNGKEIAVKELGVALTIAQEALTTQFTLFGDQGKKEEEFVTLVLNYTEGKVKKSTAINLYYGQGFYDLLEDENGVKPEEQILNGTATIILRIPDIINAESTYQQVGETINYSDIESATIYVNCYMIINNVPSTSTISCNLTLK